MLEGERELVVLRARARAVVDVVVVSGMQRHRHVRVAHAVDGVRVVCFLVGVAGVESGVVVVVLVVIKRAVDAEGQDLVDDLVDDAEARDAARDVPAEGQLRAVGPGGDVARDAASVGRSVVLDDEEVCDRHGLEVDLLDALANVRQAVLVVNFEDLAQGGVLALARVPAEVAAQVGALAVAGSARGHA